MENLEHFYEVSETYEINFRLIPGKGLAMKLWFKNLEDSVNIDETITQIFNKVEA